MRDRVELVVVTPRALDRESHQSTSDHVHRFEQHLVVVGCDHADPFVGLITGGSQEAGGDQVPNHLGCVLFCLPPVDHLVAGQLFTEKTVKGMIAVEGVDDVVAVPPLAFCEDHLGRHMVESHGVGVAGDIQPVPTESLAEFRRGQHGIDA